MVLTHLTVGLRVKEYVRLGIKVLMKFKTL